jgi:hypothetical protein
VNFATPSLNVFVPGDTEIPGDAAVGTLTRTIPDPPAAPAEPPDCEAEPPPPPVLAIPANPLLVTGDGR